MSGSLRTDGRGGAGRFESVELLDARLFTLVVKRLADSLTYGTDRSPFLGSGIEYVQSRAYLPGDPVKQMDWRVTARTGRAHVKEYEAPKCMPVWLLVDTSASMAVSSTARSKYELALTIAGGVALAGLERASPVGLAGIGERGLRWRPSLSRTQVLQWMLALRSFRFDERTRLGKRVAELAPSFPNRVMVVVLSDLHDEDALPALRRLAQLHEVAVIQLRDPAEERLAGAGLVRVREAESGREFWTHGRRELSDPALLKADLRRAGVDHLVLRTDRPYVFALRHFLEARGVLGRQVR